MNRLSLNVSIIIVVYWLALWVCFTHSVALYRKLIDRLHQYFGEYIGICIDKWETLPIYPYVIKGSLHTAGIGMVITIYVSGLNVLAEVFYQSPYGDQFIYELNEIWMGTIAFHAALVYSYLFCMVIKFVQELAKVLDDFISQITVAKKENMPWRFKSSFAIVMLSTIYALYNILIFYVLYKTCWGPF